MSRNIHSIVPPNESASSEVSLYHKTSGDVSYKTHPSSWELGKFSKLSFDTYFNVFSLGKWEKYCNLKTLYLQICGSGNFICHVICTSKKLGKKNLTQEEFNWNNRSTKTLEIDLQKAKGFELAYIKIETFDAACKIYSLSFNTALPPAKQASLAIIMPTYKREEFVMSNIKTISSLRDRLQPNVIIDLLVIDNGRTLGKIETPSVKVIPNRNYGGSGGFARGILEASNSTSVYSHIVLCDDDVELEPSIFTRLQAFYSYCANDSLGVSGSMLRLDKRNIQHENGATLNKDAHFIPIKGNIDLNKPNNLLKNDEEIKKEYAGWWFFSAPTKKFSELGLPIPVFLKWDDVEFSIRASKRKVKIIDFNGIGVWHEPFENKYSSSTFFYEERNSFIARSIHDPNFSYAALCRRLLKTALILSLGYRYDSARKAIDGTIAALKGFSHLHDILPDDLHAELLASQEDVARPSRDYNTDVKVLNSNSVNPYQRILSKITLNGHLLPCFPLQSKKPIDRTGYKVIGAYDLDYTKSFLARNVIYTQEARVSEFTAQRDTVKFLKVLFQALSVAFTSYTKFKRAKRSYIENYELMTSERYWRDFLGLK
ncbi:glycosyltransferase family 2 protein [Microbulbifer sp. TRSA007]|uniref:glycosyltransferase family 2 protein n=1 Tax=Microbulbifer sp. TRSA007 TaxID=3243384 RepID=UPI00403A04AA